ELELLGHAGELLLDLERLLHRRALEELAQARLHRARVLDADLGVDVLVRHVLRLDIAVEDVADLVDGGKRRLEARARDADGGLTSAFLRVVAAAVARDLLDRREALLDLVDGHRDARRVDDELAVALLLLRGVLRRDRRRRAGGGGASASSWLARRRW